MTAEGVEDASAYQRLAELDCDFVQGFHLGRPGDADRCRDHILRYVADFRRRRGLKVVGHDRPREPVRGEGLAASDDSAP